MEIKLIKGDITKCDTDAIVNAANKQLMGGSGVCGAIFHASGHYKALQDECNKVGPIETGEAAITSGFDLKAKYIIHAVGPKYFLCKSDAEAEELLKKAYVSSLKLADKYNLKSIAFPSISTGVYGYPKDRACKVALKAIKEYDPSSVELVLIVCFDDETYNLYNDLM